MDIEINNGGELNLRKSEFAKNLTFGLLAFTITFALLRWVL
jgi:hypothetical protein